MMKNSKSGVAVIIVLGLLALLMVLGVAFTVTMRGERAGAANYLSASATRHLAWAGISRAIDEINQTMGGDMYPPGDYLASGNNNWNTNSGGVALLTQQVLQYLPDAVADFLDDEYGTIRSSWQSIGEVGRYAYLVVNLSDMLDVNHVGGEDREGGRSVAELNLAPNILTADQEADLISLRSEVGGRFNSLVHLRRQAANANYVGLVDSFKTFSRYLPDNNRTNAVYIGGDVDDFNQTEIVAALRRLRTPLLPESQANRIFDQLLDYVGADLFPTNPEGPNSKPVPMINEVVMRVNIAVVPAGLLIAGQPQIETWAPFASPSTSSFSLSGAYTVVVEERNGGDVNEFPPVDGVFSTAQDFTIDPSGFNVPAVMFPAGPFEGVTPTNTFGLTISLSNLVVQAGSDVVDQVNGVFTFEGEWTQGVPPANIAWTPATYQVTDPRFNWQLPATIDLNSPWQINGPPGVGGDLSPSLNAINTWTQWLFDFRESGAMPAIQKGALLHSSGRGHLESPLELGNLLLLPSATLLSLGNYWQNIRVLNHANNTPRHRILENFTTASDAVDNVAAPRRGLVNINSLDERILRTAFAGMPHPYVGGDAVDVAQPERLDAVIAVMRAHLLGGNTFDSVTGLLDLDWRSNVALENLSDLELEALLAYAVELMGVRNNLYLVVASASSVGDAQAGLSMVRGRTSAMALVWRDPVANAQGLHDQFIQYFRWLD